MAFLRSARTGRPLRALLRRSLCAAALLLPAACGDGGTGPTPRPDPQNPTPSITSLDPARLLQWSDSVTVTVTGSGFVNGAVVRLNGAARLTTFISGSQVTAVVPASHMQQAGTVQVSVFNPAPGGGESAAAALPVEHRKPDLLSLEPGGTLHGSEAFTLSVHGVGFTQGSVVRWNGADRPTTFVSLGTVTAQISAADVAQAGTAEITVFSPAPGGGTSGVRVFTVAVRPNPAPAVATLSPSAVTVQTGAAFTLTGSGFMPGSQVWVGGFAPTTTYVSPTELRFALEGSNLPNPGFAAIHVVNPTPGGGSSNFVQLRVENPAPVLTAISPQQAGIGQDSLVVQLTGTGFVAGTQVYLNGFPSSIVTRRISPTELQVVLSAGLANQHTTHRFRAFNTQPGGGLSNELGLTLVNPAPVVQSISPAQSQAGQDSLVVRVTGSGFLLNTQVRFAESPRTTRFVSRTALDVVLSAADLDEVGSFAITAFTPTPGGGTSAPVNLTLAATVPVLTGLPSNGASAGRPGFALVVHGSGFLASSVVRWNGAARETRYISNTRLETTLSDADVASPGTASISVHTPGVGTSAASQLTIRAPGAVSVNGLRVLELPAMDLAYDAARSRIYASIASGPRANTVVRIDPATGVIDGSVGVGSIPGKLALSSDGSTLWVGVDGAKQVRRVALPAFTAGAAFSTGFGSADELHAMPGHPNTVAVLSAGMITVYDNGVARPRQGGGASTIAFGESAAVMYGYNNMSSGFDFSTYRVDEEGVTLVRENGNLMGGYYQTILHAGGRVYGRFGTVVDPGRQVRVGVLQAGSLPSAHMVDAGLGRAYFIDSGSGELRVFDLNTFQPLGSVYVSSMNSEHPANSYERLVRWGTDGLAVNDGQRIYLFRSPVAGP